MDKDKQPASEELKAFLNLCHDKAREAGFAGPSAFRGMRSRHGDKRACVLLVVTGDHIQSGLAWAIKHGLEDYTVEAAVIKFADEFNAGTVDAAKFRLKLAKKEVACAI